MLQNQKSKGDMGGIGYEKGENSGSSQSNAKPQKNKRSPVK